MKKQLNTACKITYPSGEVFEFKNLEEAAKGTEEYFNTHKELAKKYRPILSEAAIKLRCNKSTPPKDNVVCEWLDEHTKRSFKARQSKSKGKDLEYYLRDKLRELGFACERSAGESRALDANKVDIIDLEDRLPAYFQVKNYANTPSYFNIKDQCTKTDKPFCLFWKKNTRTTDNTVFMVPEDFFFKLLDAYTKQNNI